MLLRERAGNECEVLHFRQNTWNCFRSDDAEGPAFAPIRQGSIRVAAGISRKSQSVSAGAEAMAWGTTSASRNDGLLIAETGAMGACGLLVLEPRGQSEATRVHRAAREQSNRTSLAGRADRTHVCRSTIREGAGGARSVSSARNAATPS